MKIYGIAFIKNGIKFDFPFRESILSMVPLVDKIYVNVGIGDDGTLDAVRKIPKVEIIEVDWDDRRSDAGHILSDMTNVAIKKMREEVQDEDAWAMYLQSDEVLHEDDLELIQSDLEKAHHEGADVLRFRYMHFWQKNEHIAISKRWYPQEIRAFKVNTPIISHGDAQTFENWSKAYESDAHIWHYGHVRDEKAYRAKLDQMSRYYQRGFTHYRKKLKAWMKDTFFGEKVVKFFGDHPEVMRERIRSQGGYPDGPAITSLHLKGDLSPYSPKLLKKINALRLITTESTNEPVTKSINLNKIKWKKSLSPICRDWQPDFQMIIELSRHGIGFKKR
tara:strand:- start:10472 stop:11473 length:1002 start_codon:yes stop_codon:yes gene_type:complete